MRINKSSFVRLHDIMILQISLQRSESERSEHYLCFFYSKVTSVFRRARNKWKKNSARFVQIFAVDKEMLYFHAFERILGAHQISEHWQLFTTRSYSRIK